MGGPDPEPVVYPALDTFRDPHSIAPLLALGAGRVLDLGCGDGTMARLLVAMGCRVWGIERDKERADLAMELCETVIVADVEDMELSELGDEPFDALLCLDVLQYLVDPVEALRRLTSLLVPGGRVVASLPNVAHGAVRLQLLGGAFPFTSRELLDRGQLHFFDRQAVDVLFRAAGLDIVQQLAVMKPVPGESDGPHAGGWPEAVLGALGDAEATVETFVVSATPAGGDAVEPTAGEILATVLFEQRRSIEDGVARARRLEDDLAMLRAAFEAVQERTSSEIGSAEGELSSALRDLADERGRAAELERELRLRLEELDGAQKDLTYVERALSGREAYLAELRQESEQLEERLRQAEERRQSLEREVAGLEAAMAVAVGQLAMIKGWPAFRALEKYDAFRGRHPLAVAPLRWLARRLST